MSDKIDTDMRDRELRAKLRHKAVRLAEMIDKELPDFLIAMQLQSVLLCGVVVCGDTIWSVLGEWVERRARMYHGLCPDCSSHVPSQSTHLPICEQCEAKAEDEAKRMELEYGEKGE